MASGRSLTNPPAVCVPPAAIVGVRDRRHTGSFLADFWPWLGPNRNKERQTARSDQ
jgi:hypothetical protein